MDQPASKYCNCLYHASNALARIMTRLGTEAFAPLGLSSSYAFLLMTVNEKPGIQPKDICRQMQLTPSTVTRLIEKMEHRGLLQRRRSGRTTEVHPTKASLELQPKIKSAWKDLFDQYTSILGEEQSRQLTSAINDAAVKLE